MVLYKDDPKRFFNADTEILTLVSGYKRFMLVKVQFFYANWSLVQGLNCANELAVCCVNNIGLWWTNDVLQFGFTSLQYQPEFLLIPYKLTN